MSAILSADDLNDFISPGIACIKPVETLPAAKQVGTSNLYEVTTEDTLPPSDLPPAQISLTDCLACSGCVTSAEAVLVSLQSHSEVLQALDYAPALKLLPGGVESGLGISGFRQEGRIYVASISPQTRASLAATYGISERVAGNMIEQLLSGPEGLRSGGKYGNGFEWVVDTNVAREACLVLGAEEVASATEDGTRPQQSAKPILTSSCPGWICYAEKTHPHILPHLSRLKSPQALMGTLLKTTLSRRLGVSPDRIWHVAIMPCFDKKLEASREELTDIYWEGHTDQKQPGVRDVDCVITSKELVMLAESRGIKFATLPHNPLSEQRGQNFPDPVLQRFLFPKPRRRNPNSNPMAGTSGGNLYYILQHFLSQNHGSTLETVRGRNADVVDFSVISATGGIILKTARYYGFRNIQNLVRRLKPAKASQMPGTRLAGSARRPGVSGTKSTGPEYAYVEVMACPGGCTNGGGQVKIDDLLVSRRPFEFDKPKPQVQKDWLAMVDEAYFSGDDAEANGTDSSIEVDDRDDLIDGICPSSIKDTLSYWSDTTGIGLDRLVFTSYRTVVSDVGKHKVGHAARVVELAGKIGGGW